jgi:hypothetical protein
MKNIHILPTDKPSRIRIGKNRNFVIGLTQSVTVSKNDSYTNQNIYITSDEEIKVGDWVIEFQKGDDIGEVHFINSEYVIAGDIQKKIILTTDFTLAPDVHKIPDEFLEWFVKNPSCEEVEVKKQYVTPLGDIVDFCYDNERLNYKIIISKEEPKQLTDLEIAMKLEEIEREEPKQETPKEKAKELVAKFIQYTPADEDIEYEYAKQCALIAVDEIIIALNFHQWQNTKQIDYYIEVRQEIEKL